MEIRIADEFVEKIRSNTVEIKNNVIIFEPGNEPVFKEYMQKEKIMQFLQCRAPVFEVKLTNDVERFTIAEKPFEYFLLDAFLLEKVNELLSTCSLQEFAAAQEFRGIYDLYNEKICHLHQVWTRFSRKEQKVIMEIIRKNMVYFFVYLKWFEVIYRYKMNRQVVKKLAEALDKRRFNREILKKGMRVALYGAGEIGLLFAKVLAKMDIDPVYFIDEYSKEETCNGIPVIRCADLLNSDNDEFELIIITSVYDHEVIAENLKGYTEKITLSLEDVLEENVMGELV